ncbi:MAG: YggT family protein [Steroidobacter sp.]|jgi:YggT family protein
MSAISYLLQVFLWLLLSVFLLRVLLPLSRADARNPFSQAVIRMTNPLVLPLRRVFPAIGRMDTGAVIALILVQLTATAVLMMLRYHALVDQSLFFHALLINALFDLITLVLEFYKWATIMYALLSWVAPDTYSPVASILTSLVNPIVRPWRRIIPPFGGLDFSALFTIVVIQALLYLLGDFQMQLAFA